MPRGERIKKMQTGTRCDCGADNYMVEARFHRCKTCGRIYTYSRSGERKLEESTIPKGESKKQ